MDTAWDRRLNSILLRLAGLKYALSHLVGRQAAFVNISECVS